jgi:Ca2+/Na+ antiporter
LLYSTYLSLWPCLVNGRMKEKQRKSERTERILNKSTLTRMIILFFASLCFMLMYNNNFLSTYKSSSTLLYYCYESVVFFFFALPRPHLNDEVFSHQLDVFNECKFCCSFFYDLDKNEWLSKNFIWIIPIYFFFFNFTFNDNVNYSFE